MGKKTIRDHTCTYLPGGVSIRLVYTPYEICWYLTYRWGASDTYGWVDSVFDMPIRCCPYCGKELHEDKDFKPKD